MEEVLKGVFGLPRFRMVGEIYHFAANVTTECLANFNSDTNNFASKL